jgi:hypothetical protein
MLNRTVIAGMRHYPWIIQPPNLWDSLLTLKNFKMKRHLLTIAVAVACLFAFSPVMSVANAAPIEKTKVLANPTQDIVVGGTNALGTFVGTLDITRFVTQGGVTYAVGSLSGTYTSILGTVTTITDQIIRLPLTGASGSCQILHLELGPVDLDLLGLQIHLDKVVLDITAQSGEGKLLGNLLCAVAGLLDGGSSSALTRLLNQILGVLG